MSSTRHGDRPAERDAGPSGLRDACMEPSYGEPAAGFGGRLRLWWRWVWLTLMRNRLLIAVASLIWLIWRSGSQPRRLAYPCQQAAAANLGVFAVLVVPALARHRRARRGTVVPAALQLATGSVTLAGVLFVLISAGVAVFSDSGDTYVPGQPAIVSWAPVDISSQAQMSPRVLTPNGAEAVVAVNRNLNVQYGVQPYDPAPGSAYELTWKTIADLHLGPADNPLADFIQDVDGDGIIEVIIKPNTVAYFTNDGGERNPVYSHPAIIRPLVDMAAMAGAQRIMVGDGSDGNGGLFSKMDLQGYTQAYFDHLQSLWPGTTISRVDFQRLNHWSWIDLGADQGEAGASAYYGSGYDDTDLIKSAESAASAYFGASDAHGRPGPGRYNCLGWQAVTDYLLDADVIIDLAKLKVHYYGVSTAMLKNWVGITMFSTYDMSQQYWCRIAHERTNPTSYEKAFGNDIMWREVLDLHRGVLYWRDGLVHPAPQRRYLCVMDAINCAERFHDPDKPWPYWLHTVLASVDPVAVDAVGARLQRYDFRNIPIINNAHAASIGSAWPVGTGDPGQVRVVGDQMIDSSYDHVFLFDDRFGAHWPDWGVTVVNDLNPPTVNIFTTQDLGDGTWHVQADISNAHVVYYYYHGQTGGLPEVVRLARNGNAFDAIVGGTAGSGTLVAQDEFFNTVRAQVVNMPAIGLSTHQLTPVVHYGETPPPHTFTVANAGVGTLHYTIEVPDGPPWLHLDTLAGESTGEADPVVVSYTLDGLLPGVYAALIRVSDPAASNNPQEIIVTLDIQTVICDFDRDGDVDQSDFGRFQVCISGSGNPVSDPSCQEADFDRDLDVDAEDCALLRGCLSGAGIIAAKTCDDLPG